MEIKKKYYQKYLHDVAIDQIADEYIERGYSVSREELFDNKYTADLVARKGNEAIVIEVKAGKMDANKKQQIKAIADYIQKVGNHKFVVAVATLPKEKKLEVDRIEEVLTQQFMNELPDELDELSTHTRIDEVNDIDIDEITINADSIYIVGTGVVSVVLQFGSDNDQRIGDGVEMYENFPFEFETILTYDTEKGFQIDEMEKLEIDTSSYFL